MREYLFRGKRVEDGEWVEGSLVTGKLACVTHKAPVIAIFPELLGFTALSNYEQINPETVGQWTGLVDKNGTKIFEGDIMRNAGNVVEFCNGSFCINGDSPLSFWTETEIIGNIHDNPELA